MTNIHERCQLGQLTLQVERLGARAASEASGRGPARRAHSIQGTHIDELALTAGKLERSAHILAREKVPQGPGSKSQWNNDFVGFKC